MNRYPKNLCGMKFGRLTAIGEFSRKKIGKAYNKTWLCICSCGKFKIVPRSSLITYMTRSCGCLFRETRNGRYIHGHNCHKNSTRSATYRCWDAMVQRCTNSNTKRYHDYGGRGINVCNRWLTFSNFLEDMGEKPEGLTLGRIDNSEGYYLENCRWETKVEQYSNMRTNVFIDYNGERKTIATYTRELSPSLNIGRKWIYELLRRGFSPDELIEKYSL